LNLPNYPKNVEEMKIARYLFQQIFKCFFRSAILDSVEYKRTWKNLLNQKIYKFCKN